MWETCFNWNHTHSLLVSSKSPFETAAFLSADCGVRPGNNIMVLLMQWDKKGLIYLVGGPNSVRLLIATEASLWDVFSFDSGDVRTSSIAHAHWCPKWSGLIRLYQRTYLWSLTIYFYCPRSRQVQSVWRPCEVSLCKVCVVSAVYAISNQLAYNRVFSPCIIAMQVLFYMDRPIHQITC